MKIACLVKFVPNIDNFKYDYQRHVIIRENSQMQLNPDDNTAIAQGLKLKEVFKDLQLDVISMAPQSVLPLVRDILRVGVDSFVLLSDKSFAGSDTYATAVTLSKYLKKNDYSFIFSGTHSLDGGTAHLPMQVAEFLNYEQISYVTSVEHVDISDVSSIVKVQNDKSVSTYRITSPAILSFVEQSGCKMPFVRYDDLELYVDDKISIVTAEDISIDATQTGLFGSKTVVKRAFPSEHFNKEQIVVNADDEGVQTVHQFLIENGYLNA